jgi:hypothetical protein
LKRRSLSVSIGRQISDGLFGTMPNCSIGRRMMDSKDTRSVLKWMCSGSCFSSRQFPLTCHPHHSGWSCDTMALSPSPLELLSSRLIGQEPLRSVYDHSAELSRIQMTYGSCAPYREATELFFQRNGDVDCPKLALKPYKCRFWSRRQMPVLCPCLVNSCNRNFCKDRLRNFQISP